MDRGRLARGRSYAGPSRLVEFHLDLNVVTARLRGNINRYFGVYETPYYDVRIQFRRVGRKAAPALLEQLGSSAEWVAHLVLNEVPRSLAKAFAGAGVALLPHGRQDLVSECSCPDYANPCKHIAGTYYHLAALLDRDPLLLFELHGLPRDTVLESVRQSRFGRALVTAHPGRSVDNQKGALDRRIPAVRRSVDSNPPADLIAFWRGKPLPAISEDSLGPPSTPALLLRRGGGWPEFWGRMNPFIDAMADIYERVARKLPALQVHQRFTRR